MDEYLRRVQSRLGAGALDDPIHAVLGGPEPDVDSVSATLCLALHLSQKEPSGVVCVPVLCNAALPGETQRYLQRLNISHSSLLWKEDVDLVKLQHTRKLSLTLLRDGLLDSSEHSTLQSSILRVVHHTRGDDDGESPALIAVAREILQEAAEQVGAALGETLGEALQLQRDSLWIKHGRRSSQLEELLRSLEQRRDVTAYHHDKTKPQDLEHLLTMELKELSDGAITIALTSVTSEKEDWHCYVEGLKLFCQRHGFDCLVVLLSVDGTLHHPRQQVAVYSNNTDVLNQICSEFEESFSWSLSGVLEDRERLQVYEVPVDTSLSSSATALLLEEIRGRLKDFVDRRGSVLACHPTSRTSSTEGVAGSVEFSQGSSGINDMDGSDLERAEAGGGDVVAITRAMADGEEETGAVGFGAAGDLVSPDSGMTTIRSSRSSKESSVFLSDDSPVGEVVAGVGPAVGPGGLFLRNPSPLGLSSLSPPAPTERKKHRSSRNKSDNFDLFCFDPLHSGDPSMPAGEELANPGVAKDEGIRRAGSSSFSELEELSLLDMSAANSLGGLESRNSSTAQYHQMHGSDMIDSVVPPTPANSVVGSRPPSSCGVRFFPEDVVERINGLQHKDSVSSSLSETWDELGFETQGASSDYNAWNRTNETQSPQNVVQTVKNEESVDELTERGSKEILTSEIAHPRVISLQPQLSLVTDQTESYTNWNPDSLLQDQWNPVTLSSLQLTPPEEKVAGKSRADIKEVEEKAFSLWRKKATLKTLTPDTSKEEDEGLQRGEKDKQAEILDFWAYSAQKGFLKTDSGTTATVSDSHPESLDLWNTTIRDDSLSPLTTPDNLSENSGSFCGVNPNVGVCSPMESPSGPPDGGMAMWNTTIQEDSSSTITSPEGLENGKDHSRMESLEDNSPETHSIKLMGEEKTLGNERGINEVLSKTLEEARMQGLEHNVKIVVEAEEGRTLCEEPDDNVIQSFQRQQVVLQNLPSEYPEDETFPYQGTDMCDLPVPCMVTSTSEYDNVGADTWSLASSSETNPGPEVDMIQLEGQSSPFIAVTKPMKAYEMHDQYQKTDLLGKTDNKAVISDDEQPANQVFLFEGTAEVGHMSRSEESFMERRDVNQIRGVSQQADIMEEPSDHSPFLLVDCSTSANNHSSLTEAAESQIQTDQPLSTNLVSWHNLVSKKQDGSETSSLSHDLLITMTNNEVGSATECRGGPHHESVGNVEGKTTETLSLSSSSGGERDTLKYSPDSLHPGSRDELRSNSDGDSSSGLEMDYIIVSGTVKESEREWHDRPNNMDRQSKGAKKCMETFSMLSYAATVLRNQAQAAHRDDQGKMTRVTDGTLSAATDHSQAVLSTNFQVQSLDNATEQHIVPEMISPSQSKNDSEAFHQSDSRPTGCCQKKDEEENSEGKTSIVARSVSPSLRYPSDHFLKTREEVYVHSQISMEDSDEGGHSPSEPPPCPTSLGDFQVWTSQSARQETPQSPSEKQSPIFSNSSVSQTSSVIGTPLCESGISTDIGLGLPFSGDLMEEENQEEAPQEETDIGNSLSKWTSGVKNKRAEIQQSEPSDLLSFTEELIPGSSFQQTHLQTFQPTKVSFPQNTADCYDEQPIRTVDHDKWSTEQQIGDHGSSQDSYSPVISWSPTTPNGNSSPSAFTRYSPGEEGAAGQMMMMKTASSEEVAEEMDNREDLLSSADVSGGSNQRRKLSAPPINVSLERSEGSLLSEDALDTEDEALGTGDELDVNIDELDTPDEGELLEFNQQHGASEECHQGAAAASGEAVAAKESRENRFWRSVVIGEQEHRIDMKCIEPYKRVISHGGYYAEQNAIIVFAACFLPDSNCDNYTYVMENLFLYVISTLELMVAEDYMIVYLNGATPRRKMPGFTWMKKCYQMIDRRLKKNLKTFIIVHPSWFIRTLLGITRPFISSKFSSKIKYVSSLRELGEIIPMEYVHIPDSIVKYDEESGLHKFACMRADRKGNSLV